MPAQRCSTAHNNRQGKGVDPSEDARGRRQGKQNWSEAVTLEREHHLMEMPLQRVNGALILHF